MQLTMNPDWLEDVYLATDRLFLTRLGLFQRSGALEKRCSQ